MKKLILAASMAMASSASFAATDAGCGLGSVLWEGQEGIAPNVLAATTNGTSGNQTFGMTTGTLGCDNSSSKGFMAMNKFLDSNIDKVARDMSRGQGEALEGLASVMGITEQDKGAFFAVSKANFDRIFSASEVTRAQMVESLAAVMREDATLAKYAPMA